MNIELTTYHGSGESIIINWNNVAYAKQMKADYSTGVYDSCTEAKEFYSEVSFGNTRSIYVKETLQEIKKKL